MKNYIYKNILLSKKQLRQLLAWTFTNYDSIQACALADELKHVGFHYATKAGISISIEDLKVPLTKHFMLKKTNQEILDVEKIYVKGKMTDVERFQKIIDTWNLTSDSLKEQVVYYFKNYDPLNSVYIMAFSGARGNLSQVRQLVGMRGLMSNTSGEIMNLAIQKNFREGLTITDYLISGYGARKGIVDTALKTANSGYLTRRLIDVSQDILIREKNCLTTHSFLLSILKSKPKANLFIYKKILGHVLAKSIFDQKTNSLLAKKNTTITPDLIKKFQEKNVEKFYIRSPLTCNLYRAICQKCYGWDLANENLVDMGEAIGILAGQSIGEPGTQLTMRTFHTGGVFTSQTREQITSPSNGIIKFYKFLKTLVLRNNKGDDVLITKNSGSLILIPEDTTKDLVKIEVSKNTVLFPKNNQYILKDTVIAEIINKNKQIRTEIKPILSTISGEIVMPPFKKKVNLLAINKLFWILSGKFYSSPKHSFLNFYSDYKINPYSFIFRTKITNHFHGFMEWIHPKQNLYQGFLKITNTPYLLINSKLEKFKKSKNGNNYLLQLENFRYFLKATSKDSRLYLQITRNQQIATYITNLFTTLTGGTVYYDSQNFWKWNHNHTSIPYIGKKKFSTQQIVSYRTMIWLGEEVHPVNCEFNRLLVENGDFISKNFELIPGLFSKTSGIVSLQQKNNLIQSISIHSGLVYESKELKNNSKKLYYPGEKILSNVTIQQLSFCEHGVGKTLDQWLVRPIELFELPYRTKNKIDSQNDFNLDSNFSLESISLFNYQSTQTIHGSQNLNLVSNLLVLKSSNILPTTTKIELLQTANRTGIHFKIHEKIDFNQYLLPKLRYKKIQSAFLVQPHQFIDQYTILAYLEALTVNVLEIVKVKVKHQSEKQILLISNEDCLTVPKNQFQDKKLNDFILESNSVNEIGKIIIENNSQLTLQKGKLYFFPNCQNEDLNTLTNLEYQILSDTGFSKKRKVNSKISVTYSDFRKISIQADDTTPSQKPSKIQFPKLVWKKNGKLYSSLRPPFFKKFLVHDSEIKLKCKLDKIGNLQRDVDWDFVNKPELLLNRRKQTLLFHPSHRRHNKLKKNWKIKFQLALVAFMEHPLSKTNKSIGLSSITEDYLEQEVNSLFCQNGEFIEKGETIGLLNLEKEITGDIVQGLPKIENILEARKKILKIKRIPTSQKKGLLVQKTSLDPNLEFRKLATSIHDNDKINLHKVLKVYFNYYGFVQSFVCDQSQTVKYHRFLQNYESSYKSFKKVQSFILNSVQSIYDQQGVFIHDKHLEVIIKQMTTKVIITYEGETPLLRREVVDLYHIQYINQVMRKQQKEGACYVPFLLGITKSALNNPSFISAASFQETTRVLTKAAIEGKIDWLRGLKENIVIGHLIPSGTASKNYRHCFQHSFSNKQKLRSLMTTQNHD